MAHPKMNSFQMVTSKIETEEEALYIIKQTAYAAYIVGGIQVVLALLVSPIAFVDAALYILCGFFLQKYNSRIAGVAFFLMSCFAMYSTIVGTGGKNVVLAIIIIAIAFTAMRATHRLSQIKNKKA
jgi:hypothetical protein